MTLRRTASLAALLLGLAAARPETPAAAAPGAVGNAATPSAGAGGVEARPARSVLGNGLVLLVLERHGLPLVQAQILVRAGAVDDPAGKEGLAALTARLLTRGAGARTGDDFMEAVEFLGATIAAQAGPERTLAAGEFQAKDLAAGLGFLADMMRAPAFRDDEVTRERGLAIAELESELDDPGSLADEAFPRVVAAGHPYGRPASGTRRSLGSLTRADVVAFHRDHYAPGAAVLAVVGDVDAAGARAAVEKAFGSWAPRGATSRAVPPLPALRGRHILILDKPDATQTQIRLGSTGPRRGDPVADPLGVANTVLGGGFTSWLVDEVRVKRGLTYGIGSAVRAYRSGGFFEVTTFTRNAAVAETLATVLDLLKRMRDGGLEEADLDNGKNFLAGLQPLRVESPDATAAAILDVEFYGLGPDYLPRALDRLRAVDLRAARAAAARWVPAADLGIVAVGPASAIAEPLRRLGTVTVRPAAWAIDGD